MKEIVMGYCVNCGGCEIYTSKMRLHLTSYINHEIFCKDFNRNYTKDLPVG